MSRYLLPFALVAVIWLWPRVWYYFIRGHIDVEVTFLRQYATIGEAIPLRIVIRNRAWLPCPLAEVIVNLPEGLSNHLREVDSVFRRSTHVYMRQQVVIETSVYARARGIQELRETTLHVNEGFGLREVFNAQPTPAFVAVYPNLVVAPQGARQAQEIVGRIEIARWLHPDETVMRGMRNYQSGDLMKHIAWKATARTGQLMVKQFAATTDYDAALIVNAQFFEPFWAGTMKQTFDQLCGLACGVSLQLRQQGIPSMLATNAIISRDPKRQWHGAQSPAGIRTIFARAQPYANAPLAHLFEVVRRETSVSTPIVIITAFLSATHVATIAQLIQAGRHVQVICTPDASLPAMLSHIPVYQLRRDDEREVARDA